MRRRRYKEEDGGGAHKSQTLGCQKRKGKLVFYHISLNFEGIFPSSQAQSIYCPDLRLLIGFEGLN